MEGGVCGGERRPSGEKEREEGGRGKGNEEVREQEERGVMQEGIVEDL